MKLPSLFQFRILKEVIRAIFKGPYTTKFPSQPHKPQERFRGKPEFSEKECVGCGACAEVCPVGCIELVDEVSGNSGIRKIIQRYDECIFCGQCEANCITEKGIKLTQEYDLALFDRKKAFTYIEKELVICEYCGSIIGTKDHLSFLVKKLGPLAYGNFLLLLTSQKELELAKEEIPSKTPFPLRRPDAFRILCPRCRREVILTITGEK